ncbi:MAG TPA: hypothetical protein VF411_07495 [Bacteroidia bacterium]
MKKVSALFLLLLFCVYSFTFKTHYCGYTANTPHKHAHPDCEHQIKEAAARGDLAHANFFNKHYCCQDIVKNAQVQQTKTISAKNPLANAFTLAYCIETSILQSQFIYWLVPEACSRSETICFFNSLRAPPLV